MSSPIHAGALEAAHEACIMMLLKCSQHSVLVSLCAAAGQMQRQPKRSPLATLQNHGNTPDQVKPSELITKPACNGQPVAKAPAMRRAGRHRVSPAKRKPADAKASSGAVLLAGSKQVSLAVSSCLCVSIFGSSWLEQHRMCLSGCLVLLICRQHILHMPSSAATICTRT